MGKAIRGGFVVNSRREARGNDDVLDVSGMARACSIARPTVMNWLAIGILVAERNERIGSRRVIGFGPAYADAIAKIIRPAKKPGEGGAKLTPELEAKILAINDRFYPPKK